jgi:hypothetical protein
LLSGIVRLPWLSTGLPRPGSLERVRPIGLGPDQTGFIRVADLRGQRAGQPSDRPPDEIDVFDALRVEEGSIVEHWGVPDRLGALFQLGLAQPPATRAA